MVYPGHHPGPAKWLAVIRGVLDTARGYLDVAADPATSDDDAFTLIGDADFLGQDAYDLLQILSGAEAKQIPHQIVRPFQRWVDGLGITNTILFRADHVANYELARFDLDTRFQVDSPAPSLVEALADVTWPFMRVTVPSQALGMLPHFAIVGHELGHAIQDTIVLPAKKVDPARALAALATRLADEGLSLTPTIELQFHAVVASWAQEFKSDAVGLLIAGPAFFFALGGFFQITGGSYGISPSHPPSEMRRRFVLERLNAGAPNHGDVFERITGLRIEEDTNSGHVACLPSNDDLFAELESEYGVEEAAICVAVLELADELAREIFAEAERVLRADHPGMLYEAGDLEQDLTDHLDALCGLIPPIEARRGNAVVATSLAGNLNVGWAALLTRLQNIGSTAPAPLPEHGTPRMEKLHELLLKGVELAEARRTWDAIA